MALNYASKFAKKVAERFKSKSLTESAINRDYDWSGVSTVTVYSVDVPSMADYTVSGTSRYGTPADLGNTKQDLTVAKDRSFTYIIDRMSEDDTMGAMEAGKSLARTIDEVVIPEVDKYRLEVMATAAAANSTVSATSVSAVTSATAYIQFLAGQEMLGNAKVPVNGRKAFVSYKFYSFIKQDPAFMIQSDRTKEQVDKGEVGYIDGVQVITVPSDRLPASSVSFILCHPQTTVGVDKLEDYKIHDNPPGISGKLVEGRLRYDAFVLSAKIDGVYVHYES